MKFTVLQADVTNLNNRIYDRKALRKIVTQFKSRTRWLGELGHPDSTVVSINNVSHIVNSLELNEDILVADITLLDTTPGRTAQELVDMNQLVLRTRCSGTINPDTKIVSVDTLFAFDLINKDDDSFKGIL